MDYRAELQSAREAQRQSYARFREITALMMPKGLLRYDKDRHCFETVSEYYWDSLRIPKYKIRNIIQLFRRLQTNIRDQAMLVLELEHAIDREERKAH